MSYVFEQTVHMHHGYYEDGPDIESVAYRIKGEDQWVIFIDGDTLRALLEVWLRGLNVL